MLPLSSLRKPFTRAEGLNRVLNLLTALGFETTGWQDGRIQKTIVMTLGLVLSDLSEVVKVLAEYGFNAYANGVALNEFSRSRFANSKTEAVATRGPMTLRSQSSIPYTIKVGSLIAATDSGIEFRNVTEGTIAAGTVNAPSSLVLTFEARKKGAQGNVALNAVRRLLTPLAGVSVANSSGSPWYTTEGKDEESDASIRARNSTRWSRLTVEYVAETYEAIARSAGALKVRVQDDNPRGPGTVDVYCADETALLGTATMQAIQLELSKRAFQTSASWAHPWPSSNNSRVAVRHTPTYPIGISATLYHSPGVSGSEMVARARTALTDWLRRTPLGGWDYSPGPANVVLREDISEVLKGVDGVKAVKVTSPENSITVGAMDLLIEGAWNIQAVAVP